MEGLAASDCIGDRESHKQGDLEWHQQPCPPELPCAHTRKQGSTCTETVADLCPRAYASLGGAPQKTKRVKRGTCQVDEWDGGHRQGKRMKEGGRRGEA
jgi:hypothetical protein